MRRDNTKFVINVNFDDVCQEFIATFEDHDSNHTWGAGDTKGAALLNLIENAQAWETEDEHQYFKAK